MNYRNKVFNTVATAVREKFGSDTYVVSERVYAPTKFPCVWLIESDKYSEKQYTALDFTDEQVKSVFEAQVFSNKKSGAMEQASEIMDCIAEAFRGVSYRMTSCTAVDNEADYSIKRKAARFERTIGNGDEINL